MVFNFSLPGSRSNCNEAKEATVDESNKGINATLSAHWSKYVAAPVTYLSHSYIFNRSGTADTGKQAFTKKDESISKELVDANRGLSAAILAPWRQYVVAPTKYLSSSTQFAVWDKINMKWLFRLDKAHVKGATYPHINVNPALTGVRDPHAPVYGAVVNASGPVGKFARAAGDIATIGAICVDVCQIGAVAHKELMEKGGIGAETGKMAGGVTGGWTCGFLGATVGAKAGSMAGGLVAGPVGAGVFGILGAVAGGVGGSYKGRAMGEQMAENAAEQLAEHHEKNKCKL